MRFAVLSARNPLLPLFPRTKQSASRIFDFPEPFGPKTTLKCFPNTNSVLFPKLLNPSSVSDVICVIKPLFYRHKNEGIFKRLPCEKVCGTVMFSFLMLLRIVLYLLRFHHLLLLLNFQRFDLFLEGHLLVFLVFPQ